MRQPLQTLQLPADAPPQLLVVVDTEEQFDWSAPFDRKATAVSHMRALGPFQSLCESHAVRPTYVIDMPIASNHESAGILREIQARGACEIGAHLHPWVTPPFEELVNAHNSYPGNLPRAVEQAKLRTLLAAIESGVGVRPRCYKAGRYGFGAHTRELLLELGFEVDLSFAAAFDLSGDGGPDYSHTSAALGWLDPQQRLLEVPSTGAFTGWCASPGIYRISRALAPLPATGVLSRLGACERLFLSPEGYQFEDCQRLTRHLLQRGQRVFQFSLHSPSVEPGHTPYVRSQADLEKFFASINRYMQFFLGELGGVATTPAELYRQLRPSAPPLTA